MEARSPTPSPAPGSTFLTERYSDQGLVDIYLDNVLQSTVDTTNPVPLTQQVVYSRRGLPTGTHTPRVVKRSGIYMVGVR